MTTVKFKRILCASCAFLPFVFVSALASSGHAQKSQAWSVDNQPQTYPGGTGIDGAGSIYAASMYSGLNTTRLTKYASDGSILWTSDYMDPAQHGNSPDGMVVDTDGTSYIVSQQNQIPTTPGYYTVDFGIIKFDPNGVVLWAAAPVSGFGQGVFLDHSGNVYAFGQPLVGNQGILMKYTTAGQLQWVTTLPLPVIGYLARAVISGPYLYFSATTSPALFSDWFVSRIDTTTGAILWSQQIDGGSSGTDTLNSIAVDAAGDVVLGGSFGGNNTTAMAVMMLDANGNTQWTWTGPYTTRSGVALLDFDPNGRVIAAGFVPSSTGAGADIDLVALDHAGNLAWERTFDVGATDDLVAQLIVAPSGDITLLGSATADLTLYPPLSAFVYAFDSTGHRKWSFAKPDVPSGQYYEWPSVQLMPGGSVLLEGFTTIQGLHGFLLRLDQDSAPFCFGDGSGTACPCGNVSNPSEAAGCASSIGVGGKLVSSGLSEIGNDTLTLDGTSMPNASALYFQGTTQAASGAGSVFGDGLRCAGGTITRLGTQTNSGGASQYPGPSDPQVSVRGAVTSSGTRTYQAWYRNAAAFCTSSTFNLTNGLLVTWSP